MIKTKSAGQADAQRADAQRVGAAAAVPGPDRIQCSRGSCAARIKDYVSRAV